MQAVYQCLHDRVSAEGWSALGTWTIAGIAAFATFFALRQVREARITREKQAQPHVVAYAALNPELSQYLDFVVTNYGQTPAYHVKLKFPALTVTPYDNLVTFEHTTKLYIPDEIAVLAPGQEWRTLWDSAIEREQHRNENDGRDVLGARFEGTVKFQDSGGHSYTNPAILDWNSFRNIWFRLNSEAPAPRQTQTPPTGVPVHTPQAPPKPAPPTYAPPSTMPVQTPQVKPPPPPPSTVPVQTPKINPPAPGAPRNASLVTGNVEVVGDDDSQPAGSQDTFLLDDSTLAWGQVNDPGSRAQITVSKTQSLPGVGPTDNGSLLVALAANRQPTHDWWSRAPRGAGLVIGMGLLALIVMRRSRAERGSDG